MTSFRTAAVLSRTVTFLLIQAFVFSESLLAETLLLTGDRLGGHHGGGGEVKDISADEDLVLFSVLLIPNAPTIPPGLPKSGLYLRKLSANTVTFVGDDNVANAVVMGARISDDGNIITWRSGFPSQLFWRNIETGVTRQITEGNANYSDPRLSGDGRYVAFMSDSATLTVTNMSARPDMGRAAVYLYDSIALNTKIVSLAIGGAKLKSVGPISTTLKDFDLSADGRFIVFTSEDPNAHTDRNPQNMQASRFAVYRRELSNGNLLLLNKNSSGQVANGDYSSPSISADGNRVAFFGGLTGATGYTKMISELPQNIKFDVYTKDIPTGRVYGLSTTRILGNGSPGLAHPGTANDIVKISDSGKVIIFSSESSDLELNDDPGALVPVVDIFKSEIDDLNNTVSRSLVTTARSGNNAVSILPEVFSFPSVTGPVVSGNGSYVAFSTKDLTQLGIVIPAGNPSALSHGVGIGTFPAPPTLAPPFFIWAFDLPFGQQGTNQNPSRDGIPNLLKYFIGSDARVSDLRHLPVRGAAKGVDLGLVADNRDYMTLTVRIRRQLRQDYNWSVQTSPSLTGLVSSPAPGIQVGAPTPDGDFNVYLFRSPTPISGAEKGFMRLKVSIPTDP